MGIEIIIFIVIGALGGYSILRKSKEDRQIKSIVKEFIASQGGTLIFVQKASNSGPFQDKNYDKRSGSFSAMGHRDRRVLYHLVRYQKNGGVKNIYLRVLIEKQLVVKHEWR
jgi:hypothetical protein